MEGSSWISSKASGRRGPAGGGVEQTLRRQRLLREVNEEIARLSASFGGSRDETLSVLWECTTACAELISPSAGEFEEVRQHSGRLVLKSGHERTGGQGSVVARHDGYLVVEKPDLAGRQPLPHARRRAS